MTEATHSQATLTYVGSTETDRPGRRVIHLHLSVRRCLAATTELDVAAADGPAADAIAARALTHFAETGRIPNLPEQHDPTRFSAIEAVKLLRRHTGQDLATCMRALKRRDESAFGGDAVLALTTIMNEAVAAYAENPNPTWAVQYADHLRRCEPDLDLAFPRAA